MDGPHGASGWLPQGTGALPLAVGTVLAKKYCVERLIGEGGTGIVFGARHLQLEQKVAIKVLRTALASDEIRLRFEREARAIARIQSDHVVLVLDVGTLDDGMPFMVLEHLEGRDLSNVLKEDGPLSIADAVDCMLQVCEALEEAHANGIVHRDLKPANLFLTRRADGALHIKVVDFGISKILDKKLMEGGRDVTSAFTVLGSPRYMAPEQLRNSKEVDGRADLWSVGAVLFQLLTGKHAFDAESNVQASIKVLADEPADLRAFAPSVPPELAAIVARCLNKDVAARFQSAAELAAELRPFASERARESIERQREAREAPSLQIALSISSTSERERPLNRSSIPAMPPPSPRELPTAPRAFSPPRRPDLREAAFAGGAVGRAYARAPSTAMKIAIAAGGLIAVVVVFGVLTAAKRFAEHIGLVQSFDSEEPAAFPAAVPPPAPTVIAREPVTVPLDAAAAPP